MAKPRKRTRRLDPIDKRGRVYIENVTPSVDGGRYPAKATAGDAITVGADLISDGHDLLRAVARYAPAGSDHWVEAELQHDPFRDRWEGTISPDSLGLWHLNIEAFTDHFGTWRRDLKKRVDAGQDVDVELLVGANIIEPRVKKAPKAVRATLQNAVRELRSARAGEGEADDPRIEVALSPDLFAAMNAVADRADKSELAAPLEITVDRELARFGSWYEFFPRSTGESGKHGTFRTAAERLPHIAEMGFDIVYLPPIHPIGDAHRKGKNNSLTPAPGDVGSPWAIGSRDGGHTEVHPDLGTLADFNFFVRRAKDAGLEVALDFAVQCSPDHPWVKKHPEWFEELPDGSIRYAENPPKKYQDIYPIDFATKDPQGLWNALRDVLAFWIGHGVSVFRVDNPHTKSLAFWEWCIRTLKADHPELIFLSEAFTRPKLQATLAKLGFTQSYTYFTWKNSKRELEDYVRELAHERAHYFRPNFFANTPDILHEYLQRGGPAAFRIRAVLAATLSPSYGIYSGYEFFENEAVREGSEEYKDSEKYELRPRPNDAPGSLVPLLTRLNVIRDDHPALQYLPNIVFHGTDKDGLIAYSKRHGGDTVLVVVSLNPHGTEEGTVSVDLGALGIAGSRPYQVRDLLTGEGYLWQGTRNYVRLTPDHPAHVFHVTEV